LTLADVEARNLIWLTAGTPYALHFTPSQEDQGLQRLRTKQQDLAAQDKEKTQRAIAVFLACALLWAAIVYLCLRVL
jgi:hypothetical protein